MTEATAIYRAIMLAVEERRQQLNLPMWKVDELAGTQDGYYAKALHADAKSGRQAQWGSLQLIVEALFPGGVEVIMKMAPAIGDVGRFKGKLRTVTAHYNPKTRREWMTEIGKLGSAKAVQARINKLSPRRRKQIARNAAIIRWEKVKAAVANKPASNNDIPHGKIECSSTREHVMLTHA